MKLFGRTSDTLLPRGPDVEVKGEASYQDALASICGGKCKAGHRLDVVATLIPEPSNQYDPNAVQVHVNNKLVGYINRPQAAAYSKALRARRNPATCHATITGGWDRGDDAGHFGIWLHLPPAADL